ncbi:hypothetical protein PO124_01185 [Bacillus licheniformis]|nr:hypothetical protein [Bacillus licheniformis]
MKAAKEEIELMDAYDYVVEMTALSLRAKESKQSFSPNIYGATELLQDIRNAGG